jgi:hypothetical protein
MWDAVDPFARTLLNGGGNSTLNSLRREAVSILSTLSRLPQRLDAALVRLDQGRVAIRTPELEKRVRQLDRSTRRVAVAVVAAALFLGGIVLRTAGDGLGDVLMLSSAPLALYAVGFLRIP